MARDYTVREMRLVAEWCALNYPANSFTMRMRLGAVHPEIMGEFTEEADRRMIEGTFRRWADALVYLPGKLVLVEAKIVGHPVALGQLALYKRLLPLTPELRPFSSWPVESVLLCAVEDPVVTQLAREQGIRVEVFKPPWVDEYLAELAGRHRRAPVTAPLLGA